MQPHPYEHQKPRRPLRLPRRTTPPPDRPAPPNLRILLIVGLVLAAAFAALAVPYVIGYLLQLATR
jgi:hypothetical protein